MTDCLHGRFSSTVNVFRLQKDKEAHPENKADSYNADISIKCDECGQYFEFIGLPMGLSPKGPSVSACRCELRVPIKPCKDWEMR